MLQQFLKISSQEWQTMKPGLERIQAACKALGNPEKKINTIHVAGTNGKGSVAAMLQSILLEAGLKVGLFTSPHLLKVNERFKIGHQEISDEDLEKFLNQIFLTSHPSLLTFFELCTLIAFLYFAEQKVDIAILETGLGGRLDATNVVMPIISVITEIGLDHTEILGSDIASIAREKAGIIKEEVPVICGVSHSEARKVIEEVARERNAPIFVGADLCVGPAREGEHMGSPLRDFPYVLNLQGFHQIQNAQIVLKVLKELYQNPPNPPLIKGGKGGFKIDETAIQKGFANIRWPGRLEWVSKVPPILLDGAHNVEGMRALVEYLKGEKRGVRGEGAIRWKVLFSAASDKQVNEMLSCLQEIASEIVICKMKNSRSIDPEQFPSYKSANNSGKAFQQIKKSLREGEGILITGSLYFIGEMKGALNELNPTKP